MKTHFYLPAAIFAFALAYAVRINTVATGTTSLPSRPKAVVSCGPDWSILEPILDEMDIPPIPGAGIYKWKISTRNDSARFYFNQGINMYYGFHIIEAMASFKKAERFDPACAMIYWAQALTYGPNINDFGYRASPGALEAVRQALSRSGTASPAEKGLINTMALRYTADSADVTRAQLNQLYADAMQKLYDEYPGHPDIAALYADALMQLHPWDLWNIDGTPKPWTPPIRKVLEKLIAKYPAHPGGNHYYIHVMEPSPDARLALPGAAQLGITNPGLSHLVHMPSHIYLRTGNYNKGVQVNTNAVNSYQRNLALFAPSAGADFLYLIHNLHMKANNAMLSGDYAMAITAANETVNSIPRAYYEAPAPLGNVVQYISMTPLLIQVRFGEWDAILKMAAPDTALVYARVLYHFGRGFAYAAKNERDAAGTELDAMREWMKDSSLKVPFTPFSPAIDGARVAEELLLGKIHEMKGMKEGAITHYQLADRIESNMVYNEPRDWLLNPKQYLGEAYLQNKEGVNAARAFKKDLLNNNDNWWSLQGLYRSLQMQQQKEAAGKVLNTIRKIFPKKSFD